MSNFAIINLQALIGSITIILAFRWWVQPRLKDLAIEDVLLPFVFLNCFRYIGLAFMAKEQFSSEIPSGFLTVVGLWDLSTAILAIATAIALKSRWRFAIPMVWGFNVFGFSDLVVAFPQFFSLRLYNYDLGFIWLMFITYGLLAFLSHVYIFYRLIQHARRPSATASIQT